MKIAITGARGTVGQQVVRLALKSGHATVQIDRTPVEKSKTKEENTEHRTADLASDYNATVKAFEGTDAVIHLAAIPNPVDKDDALVHNNNVNAAFNGFRAAVQLDIKRFCYASSVNAIGLAYSNQPNRFDYFPIDEKAPVRPRDAYALAKHEAEEQAKAFAQWFPGMKIACMRIHEVAPRKEVKQSHAEDWEVNAVKQLFSWVNPEATARACILSVEKSDQFEGCEIFNVVAPTTTQDTPSAELAKKYYPETEIRGDMSKSQSFWSSAKAERLLGWTHHEEE